MTDERDESLTWEGDEELGRDTESSTAPSASAEDARESEASERAQQWRSRDLAAPRPLPRPWRPSGVEELFAAGLVLVAILSGLGWIGVSQINPFSGPTVIMRILYEFGEFLSIITPLIGVIAIWKLAPTYVRQVRWSMLLLLLTAPWPLVVWGVTQ